MDFVKKPNLPQKRVKSVVIGDYAPIIDLLNKLGTEIFVVKENENIQIPVRSHADMTVLHLGGKHFLSYDSCMADKLNKLGADCIIPAQKQWPDYPKDITVNCLFIGEYLICNTKYCAAEVIKYAKEHNIKIINTSQGYSRCSVAVIDEQSIITADKDISEKMQGEGFDVLLIRPGYIILPGYDYGFIGGCCGKISKNEILFSGNVELHPDGKLITEFVNSKGIRIINCCDDVLFDFGGFISVMY